MKTIIKTSFLLMMLISYQSYANVCHELLIASTQTELQKKTILGLKELDKVLIGQDDIKEVAVMGLISPGKGHVLFEGPTGTGKTELVKNLGFVFGLTTKRTTFNPEVTPAQLVGYKVQDIDSGQMIRIDGDMQDAQLYHADELNRSSPRTLNATMEAMEERQITIDTIVNALDPNFTVIATQNPIEHSGTFEIPEATLDRFMFKVDSGYLSAVALMQLAALVNGANGNGEVRQMLTLSELEAVKLEVGAIEVPDHLLRKIVKSLDILNGQEIEDVPRAVQDIEQVFVTRGLISWINAAKTKAYISGRNYVEESDITAVAHYVLSHRIKFTRSAISANSQSSEAEMIKKVIDQTIALAFTGI